MPTPEQTSTLAAAAKPGAPVAAAAAPTDPEIHVIPEKFYGAALRARLSEVRKPEEAQHQSAPQPGKKRPWAIPVIAGLVLFVGVVAGFVYFNQDLLFPKSAAPAPPFEPVVPPAPQPPAAPQNISATATTPYAVSLTWTDAATDETSYRIERRDTVGSYATVQSLAANEQGFADSAVQPQTSYIYRVVAVNVGGEAPSEEIGVATPALPPEAPQVPTLPPVGLDSDSDGLTDLEEPLYGSPINNPDADGDSFLDGNEVYHLYSPSGKAPGRLLDSGLVRVLESAVGWKIYAPSPWRSSVEDDGMRGVMQTGNGETFTVALEDNASGESVLDWYLARHPGILSSQVTIIQTRSGLEGLEGVDRLTTYFAWGDKVLVLTYDLDGQPFVNYRTTYEMMRNSMTLAAAPSGTSAPDVSMEPAPESAPSPVPEQPVDASGGDAPPLLPGDLPPPPAFTP